MDKRKYDELIDLLEQKQDASRREIELTERLIQVMKRHQYDPEFFDLKTGYKMWPFAMHPNDVRLDPGAAWAFKREDGVEKKYLAKDFPLELVSQQCWDHVGPHIRRVITRRQKDAKRRAV